MKQFITILAGIILFFSQASHSAILVTVGAPVSVLVGAGVVFAGFGTAAIVKADEFNDVMMGSMLTIFFGGAILDSQATGLEVKSITPEMAAKIGITPAEMQSYNAEIPLIGVLLQSAPADAQKSAEYFHANRNILNPLTQSAFGKVLRLSVK